MNEPTLVSLVVVGIVTLAAATTDIWKFKVYNVLTLPTLVVGLVVSQWNGGVLPSVLGAALGFGLLVVFYVLGGVGPGDVKLLTAVGAWLGPVWTFHAFVGMAFAGGFYAMVLLLMRGGLFTAKDEFAMLGVRLMTPSLWTRPTAQLDIEVGRVDRRRRIVPYGAMICVGFLATVAISSLGR